MTQTERILVHLKKGRPISPLQALRRFGCLRLGARIWDLRRDGYRIDRKMVRRGKKHWAEYRMASAT